MSGEGDAEYFANEHRKIAARIFQANYWSYLKGPFTNLHRGPWDRLFTLGIPSSEVFGRAHTQRRSDGSQTLNPLMHE